MPLWFVTIDTVRLKRSLVGANARAVRAALGAAADAARVRLIDASVIACGVRAVVAAERPSVRIFARRLIALSRRTGVAWRQTFRLAPLARTAVRAARALLSEMKTSNEETAMIATSSTAKRAGDGRKLATLVRHLEHAVDGALGSDEASKRVRRYVAEHDAPPDDRVAFARLCTVIFAQGIGYEAVASRAAGFAEAFSGFDPDAVAAYDQKRIESLLSAPIVRNAAKINACVENARRWVALAKTHGTYLGRIANAAAADDPATGWMELSGMLRSDFVHLGESTSGQLLKHLGFFTAFEGRTKKWLFPNKCPTCRAPRRVLPINAAARPRSAARRPGSIVCFLSQRSSVNGSACHCTSEAPEKEGIMDKAERTARRAQNLLYHSLYEIRDDGNEDLEDRSDAAGGLEQLVAISTIRAIAGRMPADVSPHGVLDELLALAARNLDACGKTSGAALLRRSYCLEEPSTNDRRTGVEAGSSPDG